MDAWFLAVLRGCLFKNVFGALCEISCHISFTLWTSPALCNPCYHQYFLARFAFLSLLDMNEGGIRYDSWNSNGPCSCCHRTALGTSHSFGCSDELGHSSLPSATWLPTIFSTITTERSGLQGLGQKFSIGTKSRNSLSWREGPHLHQVALNKGSSLMVIGDLWR